MEAINDAVRPLTNDEEKTVHEPAESWDDSFALKVAVQDFQQAEVYRTTNMDYRWNNADQLYLAWCAQRYWEGTRIPRSSIGIYTAFEQIESMLPKIMGAIFSDYPNWFQVESRTGTSPDEARMVSNLMLMQMENLGYRGIATVREVFRRCIKSAYIYGNGIAELCWLDLDNYFWYTYRDMVEERKPVNHPIYGPMVLPTGRKFPEMKRIKVRDRLNQPFLRHVSVKDFYIDPNCASPIVSDAKFACVRRLMTVEDLELYRDKEGFQIPDSETLVELAKLKPSAPADLSKGQMEAMRGQWWQPQNDTTIDPAGKRLEVIAYWTRDRLVWFANRTKLIYNAPNPYGFIPLYNAFYVDVPDRFFGLAITDVVEGEQRFQQSVINARIDELALSLNKPMVKRRGLAIPAYQLKVRPGQVIEADDPGKDIIPSVINNVTQDAYIEVQASDLRVQRATGGSSLALLGTPSPGGNSANRTATGAGIQAQATGSRIQYNVENVEDTFIEPILSDWHTLNTRFLDPRQVIEAVGEQGQIIQIDPMKVMNSRVRFSMRASAKMQSRQSLLQMMPLFAQTIMNPQFLQMLAQQQNQTINMDEFFSMILDATGYRHKDALFRPLSPEEQQRMSQPPPQAQHEMQMQADRMDRLASMNEDEQMANLVRDIVKELVKQKGDGDKHDTAIQQTMLKGLLDHAREADITDRQIEAQPEPENMGG